MHTNPAHSTDHSLISVCPKSQLPEIERQNDRLKQVLAGVQSRVCRFSFDALVWLGGVAAGCWTCDQ